MERITIASPLTKTAALYSVLCESLTLVSAPTLIAQTSSPLAKSVLVNSNIDLEDV